MKTRNRPTPTVMEQRLTLLGRAMLEATGLNDDDVRAAHQARRRALQANRVKVLQHKGKLLYSVPLPDFDVQLRAAQDVTKLVDMYPDRVADALDGIAKAMTDAERLAILASLGPDPMLALTQGGT